MTAFTGTIRAFTAAALAFRAAAGAAQAPFDLDGSFRTQIDEIYVSSIALLSNNQILASGVISFNGSSQEHGCVRLNPDGSRDVSFPAFPYSYGGSKITPWNDRFYVGGGPPRRLTPYGLVDNSFQSLNSNPEFSSGQSADYYVYPDGSVVITGYHIVNVPDSGWQNIYCLIWFNNDGTLDLTRRPRYGNGSINLIVPQPDGKFLLSGSCTTWEGVPTKSIFRVHADGTLDTSFNSAMGWGEAASMTVLEDEKILVSGLFKTTFSSPDTLHFVRLMPDGTLDPTFNNDLQVVRMPWLASEWPGNTINWGQFGLVGHTRISDGRIVMWGVHMIVDGQQRLGIAMLDADGNLMDEPFGGGGCGRYYNPNTGYLYGDIGGILEATDGYFYIWGGYKGYDDGTTNDPTQRFVSRLYGLDVGVREQALAPLELQPNPTYGPMSVALPQNAQAQHAEVLDAHGRVVWSKALGASTENVRLDLAALSEGAYVLRLRMKDGVVRNGRFVIAK